ncbi:MULTISPECIES: carbohydrate ABC transporter permease [Marivita]|jgi:multiple sugar transport system permease protein|uniref:Sugar ABC transporter permease n=1 Tax=Marivita cryptomonadis TaxID=505252 RepID=A0A9Q2RZ92_9RHOB|nr:MULTISPECIES: sugar ABC transporter permease [Marivita]MCR9169909.1 sugar ABC transporter permease [Paracoccaceae bacterium]MBM2321051.1 sugar ABC transporter permease [Marivita cryptomonadis]MBM2330632.1 sugar ABC transporter permease [Marivita cryptomonadis]MBM2340218.1 sugar ABC transporter permease [Marivita cryptomonadis]MBM2344880.1 sugar ABC transporter permease [Marivita cryptomonadis]
MKHSAFFWFVLPSAVAMLLFIFFPIVSVVVQSLHSAHEQVIIEVENCGPFGCTKATAIDQEATAALREDQPLGRFAGLEIYKDRNHLATAQIGPLWEQSTGIGDFIGKLMNLPFYKAMGFTLTFTFVVTPLTIIFGFVIAVAVNSAARAIRGPLIFFSLLPMMVTPLIGSLILFWMVDARGILGTALRWLADDPSLSVKADTGLMWVMLMVYGVWHSAPFAFIVYYAGLQTVNTDTLEAARIDGASRWQQIRHVVIPHLLPLTTFIALMQLMDNFRVFEPIVSFNASAHATSLSWAIYNDLGGETQQLSSAAATSVLTIIGVAILLSPVLIRTYRDYGKAA